MKKKGLIISTVVMVVVLIAALTTSTYAWFTATSVTNIGDIMVSVGAGSDIRIGVKTDNKYAPSVTEDDFMSETVTFTAESSGVNGAIGTWSGGTPAMGPTINLDLPNGEINVTKGIGTAVGTVGSASTITTADSNWSTEIGHIVIKAEGNRGSNTISQTQDAVANTDYIDVLLGVTPSVDNLTEMLCNITVDPEDSKTTIGMNAAIHVRYQIGDGEWKEIEIYDTYGESTPITNGTRKSNINTEVTADEVTGGSLRAGWARKQISLSKASEDAVLTKEEITQIRLVIFIAGYDDDCNDNATGVKANIKINFTATKKATSPEG